MDSRRLHPAISKSVNHAVAAVRARQYARVLAKHVRRLEKARENVVTELKKLLEVEAKLRSRAKSVLAFENTHRQLAMMHHSFTKPG